MADDNKAILTELKALGDDLRARLDSLDGRVQALEGGSPAPASPATSPIDEQPGEPGHVITVTVSPLGDVSRVRVVEDALIEIDGVRSATLLELHGDAARLDVTTDKDVRLISGLRRTLRVAFDVSESDNSSVTIALAQPRAESGGGVAAQSS